MRKVFLILLILAAVSPCLAKYSGGSGEPNDPYQIAIAEDLNNINNHPEDFNKYFIMTADINLAQYSGTQFNSIDVPYGGNFNGIFDGCGHTISNFEYNSPEANWVGLFRDIGADGIVKRIHFINCKVSGGTFVGVLVGVNYGVVSDCDVSCFVQEGQDTDCSVSGTTFVGGLAGINFGIISNCHVSGCSQKGDMDIGGLTGSNNGTISNCFAYSVVDGNAYVGGLVGENVWAVINNCFAYSDVDGNRSVGGLVGSNSSNNSNQIISKCFAYGTVDGNMSVGGLIGNDAWGIINDCFSYNTVNGNQAIGGLIGSDGWGTVNDCYSLSQTSDNNGVGGLIGSEGWGSISRCFAAGSVSGNDHIGGLIGSSGRATITASFWDMNTTGQLSSAGGTGKTTTQMQTRSTFTNAGWDFVWETVNGPNDIWAICEGVSCPKLAWQFVIGDSDNDKDVDFIDFAFMGSKWMQADSNLYCGGADLTGDGWVDLDDLAAFVNNWLQ